MQKTTLRLRLSTYAELLRHRRLSTRRSFFYRKNQKAKIVVGILCAIAALYLMGFSLTLAWAVSEDPHISPTALLAGITPFIFVADFLLRFIAQQTPAQMVKPYVLLPLPRHACVESFLFSSLLNAGNLIWLFLVIPYTLMAILPREGWSMALGAVIAFQCIIWLSSQFYLLVRTRITDSLLWWSLPIGLFALVFLKAYAGPDASIDTLLDGFAGIGNRLARFNALSWALLVGLLVGLFFLNRREQEVHIQKELSKKTETTSRHISHYTMLNRFGVMGEYFKLELKLLFRNKHPRKMFLFALFYILIFCGLYTFSDLSETMAEGGFGNWNSDIWCFMCFIMPGGMFVQRIMSYEGNYIDFLMVHKDDLYRLLLTKYYSYITLLAFPLLFALVAILLHKWSVLMVVAYLCYTTGPYNLALFHTAIINDQTLPLDSKFMAHTNKDYNYVIMLLGLGAFFLPGLLLLVINALFSHTMAYWVLIGISVPFLLTHRWWIRQIYTKMMRRKYIHLDNFRASR